MIELIPTKVCWTKGVGTHKQDKNARDAASRDAGIGKMNIVAVTSILPPGIEEITLEEFKQLVKPGQIVFSIHGICESDEPGQKVTVGMGRCRPHDKSKTGFVSERYEVPGIQEDIVAERCEKMAMQIFIDENKIPDVTADDLWQAGKTTYEISGNKVEIDSIISSGICNMDGDYTCAMVLALFL